MKKENAFTLVEVIVALAIGSMMMVAIYATVNSAQRSSSGIERKVTTQQDARSALELMAMEIRMASYNPSLRAIWVNPADCATVFPCDPAVATCDHNNRGIQEATANTLTIEMDISGNGVINTDTNLNPNETIRYVYDSANKSVTRSTNCGAPQPLLGGSTVAMKTVLVENNAAGVPVFRYYNGNGAIITPTANTRKDIRRIEITLVVYSQDNDMTTGIKKQVVYSTSVIPRNHIPVEFYQIK